MSYAEFTFNDLIEDILYVDGRLSKAKLLGVAIFTLFFLGNMIFTFPPMLRISFLLFLSAVVVVFLTLLCKNSPASLSREMNCTFKRGVVFLEFFLQNKKNILYYFPNALR